MSFWRYGAINRVARFFKRAEWVGVVPINCDYAPQLSPLTTFAAQDSDFFEDGFRQRRFCRRGTFQPDSRRKTLTVDQYNPLRALVPLGFTDRFALFFDRAKLPPGNVLSCFSRPYQSTVPSGTCHACDQTPRSCYCFSYRLQTAGEGDSLGETVVLPRSAVFTEFPLTGLIRYLRRLVVVFPASRFGQHPRN